MKPMTLKPHHDTPPRVPVTLCAGVAMSGDHHSLVFDFELETDLDALRIPEPCVSHQADDLWRHTCFEAFVRRPDDESYMEFNFSPSTCWAIYAFSAYRQGMRPLVGASHPRLTVEIEPERMRLRAEVPAVLLSEVFRVESLRIGLSAVIEFVDGHFSYWALDHPPGNPDFHHVAGCLMKVEGLGT